MSDKIPVWLDDFCQWVRDGGAGRTWDDYQENRRERGLVEADWPWSINQILEEIRPTAVYPVARKGSR